MREQYERELRETLWAKNRKLMRQICRASTAGATRASPASAATTPQLDWRVGGAGHRAVAARDAAPRGVARPRSPCAATSWPSARCRCPPREALLIRTLLNHPWLLEAHCEEVAELTLDLARRSPACATPCLSSWPQDIALDRGELRTQLTDLGLDKVVAMAERAITHRSDKFAEPEADAPTWRPAGGMRVALHEAQVGLKRALDAAERAWRAEPSEDDLARIVRAAAAGWPAATAWRSR